MSTSKFLKISKWTCNPQSSLSNFKATKPS